MQEEWLVILFCQTFDSINSASNTYEYYRFSMISLWERHRWTQLILQLAKVAREKILPGLYDLRKLKNLRKVLSIYAILKLSI